MFDGYRFLCDTFVSHNCLIDLRPLLVSPRKRLRKNIVLLFGMGFIGSLLYFPSEKFSVRRKQLEQVRIFSLLISKNIFTKHPSFQNFQRSVDSQLISAFQQLNENDPILDDILWWKRVE